MFKKMFFVAAFIGLGVSLGYSETRAVPRGPSSQVYSSDYAGVNYSTVSLSSASVQCFTGKGVFQGVLVSSFSSATPPQYILIRDTESVAASDYNTHAEVFRVELDTSPWMNGMTNSVGTGVRNFYYKPPHPVVMQRGLATKASDATIRLYVPLWTKFE